MQEKDIREKLNQELDKMAPDILDKILAEPIEPVKNEKELFGKKNKSLFQEKKSNKKYVWISATAAIAACIALLIVIIQPSLLMNPGNAENADIAFNITIDVNPSISIKVREDGTIKKVKAENSDAKKIVEKVNEKITDDTDYNQAVEIVIKQLNKSGYLQKKTNGMLLSVISDNKKFGKEKLEEIKEQTKEIEKEKDIKCTTVYQNCEISDEIVKVAEKNDVSVGKAALCVKLAQKENKSVKKMCKKSIDTLVKKAEQGATEIEDDEIIIDSGLIAEETESETSEIESMSEMETTEESSEYLEETTTMEEIETAVEETTEQPVPEESELPVEPTENYLNQVDS